MDAMNQPHRAPSTHKFFASHMGLLGCGNSQDAFFQIVKELTDNAIDAISRSFDSKARDSKVTDHASATRGTNLPCIAVVISKPAGSGFDPVVRIQVHDTGCGIPPEQVRYLMGGVLVSSKSSGRESGTFGIGVKAAIMYSSRSYPNGSLHVKTTTAGDRFLHSMDITMRGEKTTMVDRGKTLKPGDLSTSGTTVEVCIRVDPKMFSMRRVLAYFDAMLMFSLRAKLTLRCTLPWCSQVHLEATHSDGSSSAQLASHLWSATRCMRAVASAFTIRDPKTGTAMATSGTKGRSDRRVTCVVGLSKRSVGPGECLSSRPSLLHVFRFVNNVVLTPMSTTCDLIRAIPLWKLWNDLGVSFHESPQQSKVGAQVNFTVSLASQSAERNGHNVFAFDLILLIKLDRCGLEYDSLTKEGVKLKQGYADRVANVARLAMRRLRRANPGVFISQRDAAIQSSRSCVASIANSIAGIMLYSGASQEAVNAMKAKLESRMTHKLNDEIKIAPAKTAATSTPDNGDAKRAPIQSVQMLMTHIDESADFCNAL